MQHSFIKTLLGFALLGLAAACTISPEIQAKMDAYDRSIPRCSGAAECEEKWQVARDWALANSNFPILTESEDRIMASSTLISMRGIGVVVTREASDSGFAILVDVECFSAYGCPDLWDLKLDFNRVVNGG